MTNGAPATKSHHNQRTQKEKQSIIIHSGQARIVVVNACSNCGYKLKINKVEIASILTRFKCPQCGQSIENSNENRCKVCHTMCSDSETYNTHKFEGCSYAGTLYPWKGALAMRDGNVKVSDL